MWHTLVLFALLCASLQARTHSDAFETSSDPFSPASLEEIIHLKFSGKGFTVTGRGAVSSEQGELYTGNLGEAHFDDGLHFGDQKPGHFSISNVDLRGSLFSAVVEGAQGMYLPAIDSEGILFKFAINFGKYEHICELCDEAGSHSTCRGRIDELPVYKDSDETLFSIPVEGSTDNIFVTLQRSTVSKPDPFSTDCTNEVFYTFSLTVSDTVVATWVIYKGHNIWLEDGNDHQFVFSVPRTNTWDAQRVPQFYLDGRVICTEVIPEDEVRLMTGLDKKRAPFVHAVPLPNPTSDYIYSCRDATVSGLTNPISFLRNEASSTNCGLTRLYLGNRPDEWNSDFDLPSIPYQFQHALRSATFKEFFAWNYRGWIAPDMAFFCSHPSCASYSSPTCLNEDSAEDITPFSGCSSFPSCDDLGLDTDCAYFGDACATGDICCLYECVDSGTEEHCGGCTACSANHLCCNNECVDQFSDANNCYGCDRKCAEGTTCCDDYRGCTGSDYHCDSCGDNCLSLNSQFGDDFHCCDSECVNVAKDISAHCGACGNDCDKLDNADLKMDFSCCSGSCVQIGTNEHCSFCGNSCMGEDGALPRACCDSECVDIDSDEHCGSCGNDCRVEGMRLGKTLHCCDGLCVEWDDAIDSCGCPNTDCIQEFQDVQGGTWTCCGDSGTPFRPGCVQLHTDANCDSCGDDCEFRTCCYDVDAEKASCKDTHHDDQHCGACFAPCASGETCCGGVCKSLNTIDDCSSCNDACAVENSEACCASHDSENHQCIDTNNNNDYCGPDCVQCDTTEDENCCGDTCHKIANIDTDCGCGADCTTSDQVCCEHGGTLGTCTSLGTKTDCHVCGDACLDAELPECCPTMDTFSCTDLYSDRDNCGKCGRECAEDELCCSGQCKSISEHDSCGGCFASCSSTQLCCKASMSQTPYMCQDYSNSDTECGCPDDTVDCTALPVDMNGEYYDEEKYCCKGSCLAKWEDCKD